MKLLDILRWKLLGGDGPAERDADIQALRERQHRQVNNLQGLIARQWRDRWSEAQRDSWKKPEA